MDPRDGFEIVKKRLGISAFSWLRLVPIPPNIPPPMTGCFWILVALSGSRDLKKALGHRPANCRQGGGIRLPASRCPARPGSPPEASADRARALRRL